MSNVYALSAEGIHNAEIALERAARRIATGFNTELPPPFLEDTVQISEAGRSASSPSPSTPVDFATEIVAVKQAETALRANLKAFAAQRDLEREAINLYA